MNKINLLQFSILLLALFAACQDKPTGEKLAKIHCASCHAFPRPDLLDKVIWKESVLPEMAFRMGLNSEALFKVPYQDIDKIIATIPANPAVTKEEYELIKAYFIENAPESLKAPQLPATDSLWQFSISEKRFPFYKKSFVTALNIDTVSNMIFMGDRSSVLYQFDRDFNLVEYTQLESPPSKIAAADDTSLFVSLIGSIEPSDQEAGALIHANKGFTEGTGVLRLLQRPVDFHQADLNGDGREDFIVCSFGNFTGQLAAFEKGDTSYIKHVISNSPGARNVVLEDVNKDGLTDMLVLFTQGNERISLFLNKGNFEFQERILLQFPPVYGSGYFEIADFNGDGHFDILYANGDNADYSVILKPYHGVKIYLNQGDMKFEEFWSYPMHGASKAIARDFDQDGDLDIAAISFFPDFKNHPHQSFIYFENKGNNKFEGHTSAKAALGRWMVMEVGDYDGDGDEDILLGAHNLQMNAHLEEREKKDPVAILSLENMLY